MDRQLTLIFERILGPDERTGGRRPPVMQAGQEEPHRRAVGQHRQGRALGGRQRTVGLIAGQQGAGAGDVETAVGLLIAQRIPAETDAFGPVDELQESSNIEDRIRRIMSWLGEDMVKLQEQVRRLEALATAEDRYRLAYLLVGESGGNILRSFVAAGESADRVLEGR